LSTQIFAQAPQGFKYQAVIRDADGAVRAEKMIPLQLSICARSSSGTVIFTEPHAPISDKMGYVAVTIGSQNPIDFKTIDWSQGPYFLKVEVDDELMGVTELQSVPYAMYADVAKSAESIPYAAITNSPNWADSIHNAIVHNLGYSYFETDSLLNLKSNTKDTYSKFQVDSLFLDKVDGAAYSNTEIDAALTLKANSNEVYSIIEIDTKLLEKANVSDVYTQTQTTEFLNAKADTITVYTRSQINTFLNAKADAALVYTKTEADAQLLLKANASDVYTKIQTDNLLLLKANTADLGLTAFSNDYNDLSNKPIFPTKVSAFLNDAGYLTTDRVLTEAEVDTYVSNNGFITTETDPVFASSPAKNITLTNIAYWNAKSEFDGAYGSLTGTPDLTVYPFKTDVYTKTEVNNLVSPKANTADLKPVALSGNYNDLTAKPTIPVYVSDLINDAGYVTTDNVLTEAQVDAYVSNNGYVTSETDPFFSISAAKNITSTDITNWDAKSTFSGSYLDLTNKPNLTQYALATNVYTKLETDNALALKADISNLGTAAFSNDYLDLLNRPTIPTQVSQLTNDAGYITAFTEVDGSVTNEIQTLSLASNQLTISGTGGNIVIFTNWDTDATNDVTLIGDQTITGNKSFSGTVLVPTPSLDNQAANKAYVDALETQVSQLQTQVDILNQLLLDAGITAVVKDIDGNMYKTVKIGSYMWLAENLKTTTYNDGTPIDFPNTNNALWTANTTGAYGWYDNDEANKTTYGALYNWYAVASGKLCPSGWVVPTDIQWQDLETALGMADAANSNERGINQGTQMKTTTLWSTNFGYIVGTNTSKFSVVPGGKRNISGNFDSDTYYGYLWTATESGGDAWYRSLGFDVETVNRSVNPKANGASVRCVKQ